MLAIEGPIASNSAPTGRFPRIHWPASRPPATPPVPARKLEPADDGCTRSQDVTARLATSRTATAARNPVVVTASTPALHRTCGRGTLTTTIAASTATGTAIGSRYW